MLTDDETPVTKHEDNIDTSLDNVAVKLESDDVSKKSDKKSDAEDPKPRIVLTFRSDKSGAKSSNMKIVSSEEKEISPKRSNRSRYIKRESDEDNVSHADSEEEDQADNVALPKRSTRRRSKEFSDVIANAIARKEKSYNENSPAPSQRLSRRIKPTAKILANEELRMGLESQNYARLGISTDRPAEEGVRTRRSAQGRNAESHSTERRASKRKMHKESAAEGSDRESDYSNKKLIHLCNLGLKVKDEESSEAENRKTESSANEAAEEEEEEIDDDTEVISKLLEDDEESASDEEFCPEVSVKRKRSHRNSSPPTLRRSSRKANSGMYYFDTFDVDDQGDSDYPLYSSTRKSTRSKGADDGHSDKEEDKKTPNDAEVDEGDGAENSTEEPTIMATCDCEKPSNVYAAPSKLTEPVFCQAIDTVDGVRVGCSHTAARGPGRRLHALRRAGPRTPYILVCRLHAAQLEAHMCCANCGLFCTQGEFAQCSKGHLFHEECALEAMRVHGCPHCGVAVRSWAGGDAPAANARVHRVRVAMRCSNRRVFLPEQREQCVPAFLGFPSKEPENLDPGAFIPEELMPLPLTDIKKLFDSFVKEEEPIEITILNLFEAIIAGESIEDLVPKISLLRGSLDAPLAALDGGTCAHAAAARGRLGALSLLQLSAAALDSTDALARTPLMRAVLALLDKDVPEEVEHEALLDKDVPEEVEHEALLDKDVPEEVEHEAVPEKDVPEEIEPECNEAEVSVKTEVDTEATVANDVETPEEKFKPPEEPIKEEDKSDKSDSREDGEHAEDPLKPSDDDLIKVIKYLVAAGCDVNKHGPEGMTALHMAAQFGSETVCNILLEGGALVDPKDRGGWTPLVRAAEHKHRGVARLLLSHGADAASTDHEGNQVVHWCALAGDCRSLALLLQRAPRSVDAPNAHTDTPLHIAAREGHYSCVIVLLARGARTDLENAAGELPVEVSTGQCRDAISLNMQMTMALKEKNLRHRVLSSDISNGRELHPVPCVNEVDDATLPEDFTYVAHHVLPSVLTLDDTIETMQGCACAGGDCGGNECACCALSVRRWHDARGRLPRDFPYHDPPMLFECNATCACNMKRCTNRVVSRVEATGSLGVRVEVFRTETCGWGLRTTEHVARGTLIALYCGELLTHDEADSRAQDQYMFALDLKPDLVEQCGEQAQLCVDAARYGSAARFMNHSCRPSAAPVRVFTAARDLRRPAAALYALRDLPAGAELTFDYGDKFWSVKSKWMKCECESPDCRYPTIATEESDS